MRREGVQTVRSFCCGWLETEDEGCGRSCLGELGAAPALTGFDYKNVSPANWVTGPGPNFSETSQLLVFHPAATNHGSSPSFYIVSKCGGNNAIR